MVVWQVGWEIITFGFTLVVAVYMVKEEREEAERRTGLEDKSLACSKQTVLQTHHNTYISSFHLTTGIYIAI